MIAGAPPSHTPFPLSPATLTSFPSSLPPPLALHLLSATFLLKKISHISKGQRENKGGTDGGKAATPLTNTRAL